MIFIEKCDVFFLHNSRNFITFVSVKQQVTDIANILQGLSKQIESMQKTIDSQHLTICHINRTCQAQLKEIRDQKNKLKKLQDENRELRERLAKYENPNPPKDSNNSSTPPSKEPIKSEITRRTKSLRQKSDNPVGGQPGHEGKTRMVVDIPDETEEVSAHYCRACGRDLSDIKGEFDYRQQEVDLPEIRPVYRERRFYKKVCTCGCCNTGYAPRKRGGNAVTFGKRVRAVATYLSVVQCMPYERLQSLFSTMFNLNISQGTLANIVREMLEKSKPAIGMIERLIKESKVVGFDESGCYCKGNLNWSWIAQTVYLTLVFRDTGRGAKVLEDRFGDSLKNMIAVSDRHSAYFAINFLDNQVCLAHLLRNLEYLNDIDKEQTWAKEVQELLREAIHVRNENPAKSFNVKDWLDRLDNLLKQNLDGLKKEFNELKKGILKRRSNIFKFLEDPLIPPDNNASERGIRKLKIKQKISGVFRSETGADAFHAIHSIADTAWKNGQSPLDAILALV